MTYDGLQRSEKKHVITIEIHFQWLFDATAALHRALIYECEKDWTGLDRLTHLASFACLLSSVEGVGCLELRHPCLTWNAPLITAC